MLNNSLINNTWKYSEKQKVRSKTLTIVAVTALILLTVLNTQLTPAATQQSLTLPLVSGGNTHSLYLKSDGTVWSWGQNNSGQLAQETEAGLNYLKTPTQIDSMNNIKAISGGQEHSLALNDSGTVYAWGSHLGGRLGDGIDFTYDPIYYTTTPQNVKDASGSGNLTEVKAISAGFDHSLALKEDGTVWAWGLNTHGKLGSGSEDSIISLPVKVKGPNGSGYLTDIVSISADGVHSMALKDDGTVWTWGYNSFGQLGNGEYGDIYSDVPLQVKGSGGEGYLSDIVAISAGHHYSLAVRSDGTVWAWGYNYTGLLGIGTDGDKDHRVFPIQVVGPQGVGFLKDIVAVAAGEKHSLALSSDGLVWAWGQNYDGQLGDGTGGSQGEFSNTPVKVHNLNNIIGIGVGSYHSLAVEADGTIWAWGDNYYGQLGDGTEEMRTTPILAIEGEGEQPIVSEQPILYAPWLGEYPISQGNNADPNNNNHSHYYNYLGLGHLNTHAIDVSMGVGNVVLSPADGTVIQFGSGKDQYDTEGLSITLRLLHIGPTGRWYVTTYMHLDRINEGIEIGKEVRQGDRIAYSGNSGIYTTGPHLHFQLGEITDPNHKNQINNNLPFTASIDSIPIEQLKMQRVDSINSPRVIDDDFRLYNATKGELDHSVLLYAIDDPGPDYRIENPPAGGIVTYPDHKFVSPNKPNDPMSLKALNSFDELYPQSYISAAFHGLIDQDEILAPASFYTPGNFDLAFLLSWGGSELKMTVYRPDGQIYEEFSGTEPPIAVEVEDAEEGEWSYTVTGIDVPHEDYPYMVLIGQTPSDFTPTPPSPPIYELDPSQSIIYLTVNPSGGGMVSGSGIYNNEEEATAIAIPNDSYEFINWTEDLQEVSVSQEYPFTVSGNRKLVANFRSTGEIDSQPISNLNIGDRVVDTSWAWEHRAGRDYSYGDFGGNLIIPEVEPVTWIVVAKDHYGNSSGVTLLAEELIGLYPFDNSTIRGDVEGNNHWGDSGLADATRGLRPWLNSSAIHTGEGFYQAFSESFRKHVTTTTVPNREAETGLTYTTEDKVFIPSTTELGDVEHLYTYEIGSVYEFFEEATNTERVAKFGDGTLGYINFYWTRSPNMETTISLRTVSLKVGTFHGGYRGVADDFTVAVRPALNVRSTTPISAIPNDDGHYEILGAQPDPTIKPPIPYERFVIEINAVPTSGGTVTGDGIYSRGQEVTIAATPDKGYLFVNWTKNGLELSTNQSYSFLVFEDQKIDANFTLQGDVNNDGEIDIVDAVAVMKHILELEELPISKLVVADVNGDGEINVIDVTLIMRRALGLIDEFPSENY